MCRPKKKNYKQKEFLHDKCPICGSRDIEADRTINSNFGPEGLVQYVICLDCGTIIADNLSPIDYLEEYGGDDNVRMYLELEAGYSFFCKVTGYSKEVA